MAEEPIPDWSEVCHAYGSASDTPRHLANLLSREDEAHAAALDYLWGAVLHQGTVYSATGPAALAIASMLADPRLDSAVTRRLAEAVPAQPLRASLLDFLAAVGESCRFDLSAEHLEKMAAPRDNYVEQIATALQKGTWSDEWPNSSTQVAMDAIAARSILGCRRVLPNLFLAVVPHLDDTDPQVRLSAINAAVRLSQGPEDIDRRREVAAAIQDQLGSATSAERAALALSLGDLGYAPRELLADPSQTVRACAALAPALGADTRALGQILEALNDPVAVEKGLPVPIPQLELKLRFRLVRAAIERSPSFDELVTVAVSVVKMASKYTVDLDWGPLLRAAFPNPLETGRRLSSSQIAYLGAVVDNADLWDPRFGNPLKWFKPVGLPYDREKCRQVVAKGAA